MWITTESGSVYPATIAGNMLTFTAVYGDGSQEVTTYTLVTPSTFTKVSAGTSSTGAPLWTCTGNGTKL